MLIDPPLVSSRDSGVPEQTVQFLSASSCDEPIALRAEELQFGQQRFDGAQGRP